MKQLERRFNIITRDNPNLSSMVCFFRTVGGSFYSRKVIRDSFNQFVDKDDYRQDEKDEILSYLFGLK